MELEMIQRCAVDLFEQTKFFWGFFSLTKYQPSKLKAYLYHHLLAYHKGGARCFSVKGKQRGKKECKVFTFAEGEPSESVKKDEKWEIARSTSLKLTSLGVGPIWWSSGADVPYLEEVVPSSTASVEPPTQKKRKGGGLNRPNKHTRNRQYHQKSLVSALEDIQLMGTENQEHYCLQITESSQLIQNSKEEI